MFIQNRSTLAPKLARSRVDADLAIAAVVVESAYRRDGTSWVPCDAVRTPTDPPDTAKEPLWEGTSVTATGSVQGPDKPPHVSRAALAVGEITRTVLVFGDRIWLRNAGKIAASSPQPFERKPLSWSLAFGGHYELPPGLCPVRRMPHPGGRIVHPVNPKGTGYYPNERVAEGRPLPSIEWAPTRTARWGDPPAPAGLSPCPDLAAMRVPEALQGTTFEQPESRAALQCRLRHPAPGPLIFPELPPGTPVVLKGVGPAPVAFAVPRSPVRVTVRRGATETTIPFGTRWIHVDADTEIVRVCHSHSFGYRPAAPPSWVFVGNA